MLQPVISTWHIWNQEQRANAILLDLGRLDVWAIQTSSLPKSENVWASLTQLAEPMSSLGSRTVSQIFW